jgi:hypothetical protein
VLNAILEGKAGRITLNEGIPQSWRTVFQSYEDLLTAAIWSRINYLSPAAMEHFFSALLGINGESWGAFESINFWPKYVFPNPVDENMKLYFSGQERFAEPDVVITFEHIALIVEVKHRLVVCNISSNGEKNFIPIYMMMTPKILSIFSLWAICLEQQQTGLLN